MPYDKNDDLPQPVRDALPEAAQNTWRAIFNSAFTQYEDDAQAAATAWAGLKRAGWRKDDAGAWVKAAKSFEFAVTKVDAAQRLVFGWAMISKTKDGTLVTDLQGDQIEPDELEKAAYEFVLNKRAAGEMHAGETQGQLVESIVFTPEKMAKMGIPEGILPSAHWVGFKLAQPLFDKVKDGTRMMFSIAGDAERVPVVVV